MSQLLQCGLAVATALQLYKLKSSVLGLTELNLYLMMSVSHDHQLVPITLLCSIIKYSLNNFYGVLARVSSDLINTLQSEKSSFTGIKQE